MSDIVLECAKCRRRTTYARSIDPNVPASVATIVSSFCDRCDVGDFGTETWLDTSGKAVSQDDRGVAS